MQVNQSINHREFYQYIILCQISKICLPFSSFDKAMQQTQDNKDSTTTDQKPESNKVKSSFRPWRSLFSFLDKINLKKPLTRLFIFHPPRCGNFSSFLQIISYFKPITLNLSKNKAPSLTLLSNSS